MTQFLFLILFFGGTRIEPKDLCTLGKCSRMEFARDKELLFLSLLIHWLCLFLLEAQCLELRCAFDLLHQTLVMKHSLLQEGFSLEQHLHNVTQVAISQAGSSSFLSALPGLESDRAS